jgi:hypothetical protein
MIVLAARAIPIDSHWLTTAAPDTKYRQNWRHNVPAFTLRPEIARGGRW